MDNVVIVGAGRLGRALECILKERAGLELWDTDFAKHPEQKELAEIIPTAGFVLVCTPSWTLREALSQIKPLLDPMAVVILFQKGIEEQTLKLSPEIGRDVLGEEQPIAYIGGPMMAEECLLGQHSFGVVASQKEEALTPVLELFSGSTLRLESSSDLRGVPLAGVLKNVYSFVLGLATGLGWGKNACGWLAGRSIAEMDILMEKLGGDVETVYGPAGIADFIATAFNADSRNRTHGAELASRGSSVLESEGARSLPALLEMVPAEVLAQSPLLRAARDVAISGRPAKEVFDELAV
ncbi:MAG: hypothetical protein COU11_00330 [Candidatus Harrisonbacteria bacterium CG10_big_fil_rev_8_21_14_0_10_49_15]|uniref:Glycerol-3-phosphate dehydrogenase n=1 Tax=Candidatus Harrisonbacteria bacterium CG10_big_fil_rev_8_21_14_0_10_49_15 TaxID=1974587 RepID=A0A2H0UM34_9BACT|nr:MAG: hypothetical protein COU11_00330 [Candidatus Harrisonbacteria bacterium CG10_big_fil_rev_8_21_14_0_10_49_15]